MHLKQLQLFVIRPTLDYFAMGGTVAEQLLLGTIADESHGVHIDQRLSSSDVTLGPAIGLYQIEPATHQDLRDNFLAYRPELQQKLWTLLADWPTPDEQLATNLSYATAVARLQYYRHPEALPLEGSLHGLWMYYKKYWNSFSGKATEEKWKATYRNEVAPLF